MKLQKNITNKTEINFFSRTVRRESSLMKLKTFMDLLRQNHNYYSILESWNDSN